MRGRHVLVVLLVVTSLVTACDGLLDVVVAYFLGRWIWGGTTPHDVANEVQDAAVKPIRTVALGGGTEIVFNALTHNFLGIRELEWEAFKKILENGGSLLITGIWAALAGIVSIISTISREVAVGITQGVGEKLAVFGELLLSFFHEYVEGGTVTLPGNVTFTVPEAPDFPGFRLIRGRRDVRKDAMEDISSHPVLQCLPLVLCAINTDPQDLVAPREPAAAGWFRSWRALTPRWVTDAVTPPPPHTSCLEAFPACPWATPTQNNISD